MQFDFNATFSNLDGNPVLDAQGSELNKGKWLAFNLANSTSGDVVKFMDWALQLHHTGKLELDRADQTTIKNFIIALGNTAVLLKAQILDVFDAREKQISEK